MVQVGLAKPALFAPGRQAQHVLSDHALELGIELVGCRRLGVLMKHASKPKKREKY